MYRKLERFVLTYRDTSAHPFEPLIKVGTSINLAA